MFDTLEAPPCQLALEDLVEELSSVFAQRDRIEARIADLLRQTGETKAFGLDGYSSLTALLKHRMSLHPGEAQRLVARANGLANTPLIALAYARVPSREHKSTFFWRQDRLRSKPSGKPRVTWSR